MAAMAVMASQRRRWQEGAGKRAGRLNSPALASKLTYSLATVTVVATAQARRPGSSDGDGEADVERATKKSVGKRAMAVGRGRASKRALATESN